LIKNWMRGLAIAGAVLAYGPVPAFPLVAYADTVSDNRAVMQAFTQMLYQDGQVRAAYEMYASPDLIQHNPNIADGREAAISELEGLLKNPDAHFEIEHMAVDGDLAFVHFKGQIAKGAPGAAVVEIFRLKHGKIVEHWDVFQMMAPSTKNAHPYF
jgi:predicted SnoaL-like aldol condensation-catalyzing enzyme